MKFLIIMMPFIGTMLGSAMVFFIKDKINPLLNKILLGFASGVMIAASVWSLLIPSLEMSEYMGKLAFMPVVIGLILGVLLLLILDYLIPHLHIGTNQKEGLKVGIKRSTMIILAIALHNFSEGAATGVMMGSAINYEEIISLSSAFSLSLGIAIQNFPEGAIVALPLKNEGMSRFKAFIMGTLSGLIEPIATIMMIFLTSYIASYLPYLLSFAAGAMIYVVIEELIPEASIGNHSNLATIGFFIGFILMIILDVAL